MLSFKMMERADSLQNVLVFSVFFIWNVPWHAAVTSMVLVWIFQFIKRLAENSDEIVYVKKIARTAPRLMALKRRKMAVFNPSTNSIRGYPKQSARLRDGNSAGKGSGGFCHQL